MMKRERVKIMSENFKKPIVTIEMENGGTIKIELYPSKDVE